MGIGTEKNPADYYKKIADVSSFSSAPLAKYHPVPFTSRSKSNLKNNIIIFVAVMFTKNAGWKLNSFANWYRKASTIFDVHSPNLFPLAKILQSGLHLSFQIKTQNRLRELHRLFQPHRVVAEGIRNPGLKEWIQKNLQKISDSPPTESQSKGPPHSTGEQIKTMIVLDAAHLHDFTSILREDSPPACLVVLHIRKNKQASVQWEFFQKGYKGAVIECWNTGLLYPLPPKTPRLHLVLCHYILKPWRAGFF